MIKIIDPTGELNQGQIYDSNRNTLLSALKEQGFHVSDVGIARDRLVCPVQLQWLMDN